MSSQKGASILAQHVCVQMFTNWDIHFSPNYRLVIYCYYVIRWLFEVGSVFEGLPMEPTVWPIELTIFMLKDRVGDHLVMSVFRLHVIARCYSTRQVPRYLPYRLNRKIRPSFRKSQHFLKYVRVFVRICLWVTKKKKKLH